jgi:hypothetical protein
MTDKGTQHRTDEPISDVYANPQDVAAGQAAAEDQERVERGQQPAHDEDNAPRPAGKAEPA